MEDFLKLGIINWYPFKKNSKILFLGRHHHIFVDEFLGRGHDATSDINHCEKFNYIVADRVLELSENPTEEIRSLKGKLFSDGHIIFICENRLALRFFAGDKDPYTHNVLDGIENYPNRYNGSKSFFGRCYSKSELEKYIVESGIGNFRGYSVYPSLLMPQQIYSWNDYPNEDLFIRYTDIVNSVDSMFLRPTYILDSLVQNNMFHQMANAFLIDCSEDEIPVINSITISQDRGKDNALATVIKNNNTVEKRALYKDGCSRLKCLVDNTNALKQAGVCVVPLTDKIDTERLISMPFINASTALDYFDKLIYEDVEVFEKDVCRFLDSIISSSIEAENVNENFSGIGPVYEAVYTDMVPLNCFYDKGEFVYFDQEYCEHNYPIKVVLVRALENIYAKNRTKKESILPEVIFAEKYGLKDKWNQLKQIGEEYICELRHKKDLTTFYQNRTVDHSVVAANRVRMNISADEYVAKYVNIFENIWSKKIYVFGSGKYAKKFFLEYGSIIEVEGIIDNSTEKEGLTFEGIEISNPRVLYEVNNKDIRVFICALYTLEIEEQLKNMGITNYVIYNPNVSKLPIPPRSEVKKELIKSYHVGYIAGVFDLFHIGHLNLLKKAKEQCDYLIVGVVTDEQAVESKKIEPYICEDERLEIVGACKYVDRAVLIPKDLADTREAYKRFHFDVQFSGSDYEENVDWINKQVWLRERGSDLVFFPYTEITSSTKIRDEIKKNK